MAFDRIKKTKSGSYKYRVESYWDSTLQAPRSRSVYLGKIDEATGELIKSKKTTWTGARAERVLDFGHVTVCRRLAEDAGILPALRASFGDERAELLLLLATYLVCEESPLSMFERWQEGVYQAVGLEPRHCTSSAISGLLQDVGVAGGARLCFQKDVAEANRTNACHALLDATSISTYSQLDGFARYGHNRDGERLPQVNLQLVTLQPGNFPVVLRMIEGSVNDVSTLKNAIALMASFGIDDVEVVADRGYFSAGNLAELHAFGAKVLIPVPSASTLFKDAMKRFSRSVRRPDNAFTDKGATYYAVKHDLKFRDIDYEACLFLNETRKQSEVGRLYDKLEKVEHCFASERPEHRWEAVEKMNQFGAEIARLFKLARRDDGVWEISRKGKAISRRINRMGFMLLISTRHYETPLDMLEAYHGRDAVEKLFDNLKNALDCDRLRVHTAEGAEGKTFLALLAMMLHAILQERLAPSRKELGRRVSPREAMMDLRNVKYVKLPDGTPMLSEIARRQRRIVQLLNVPEECLSVKTPSGKENSN